MSESLTTYPSSNYNWTTVTNFDFSAMSATARQRGTLTHYMSFRAPVHGLVRLVVDESVIRHCRETETLPTRDINYGQIMIESAYCYDEPALDMRSWYAWNFHTAGWNTADKRFAYLFDSPDGLPDRSTSRRSIRTTTPRPRRASASPTRRILPHTPQTTPSCSARRSRTASAA